MFRFLFEERKLSDRVFFVRDYETVTKSGNKIVIPKGSKGSKVQEFKGSFLTYEDIRLDEPVITESELVYHVTMEKDFRFIDNLLV